MSDSNQNPSELYKNSSQGSDSRLERNETAIRHSSRDVGVENISACASRGQSFLACVRNGDKDSEANVTSMTTMSPQRTSSWPISKEEDNGRSNGDENILHVDSTIVGPVNGGIDNEVSNAGNFNEEKKNYDHLEGVREEIVWQIQMPKREEGVKSKIFDQEGTSLQIEEQDMMQQFQPLGTMHPYDNQQQARHRFVDAVPSSPLDLARKHTIISQQRLLQALSDSVHQSDGIIAVEVWALNQKRSHIVRVEGGYYRHPNYKPPSYLNQSTAFRSLSRLEDSSREDYKKAKPVQPGVGIAGQLWMAASDVKAGGGGANAFSAFGSYHGGAGAIGSPQSIDGRNSLSNSLKKGLAFFHNFQHHAVDPLWKDLKYLAQDPDHIPDDRLDCFLLSGISLAAGIKYNLRGGKDNCQGLVIYYAREGTPLEELEAEHNSHFLCCAADCIGAALAISEPRAISLKWKNSIRQEYDAYSEKSGKSKRAGSPLSLGGYSHVNPWPKIGIVADEISSCYLSDIEQSSDVHSKLSGIHSVGGCSSGSIKTNNTNSHRDWRWLMQSMRSFLIMKKNMLLEKTFGGKTTRPPPAMSFSETGFVLVGTSLSLILVSFLSCLIPGFKSSISSSESELSYAFPLGPLGALATLQFSLTAAPASQPRNVIYGTAIAGAIGLCFSHIPPTMLPHWFRLALGTSSAIATMAKLGVTHPPAGAVAILYCSGGYHFGHLGLSLLGCCVCMFVAVAMNNLNERRQYPMYWKFLP